MDEFVRGNRQTDVRGAGSDGREKDEIAGGQGVPLDRLALGVLPGNGTGYVDALLGEDVADEPTAIETGRVAAAVPVRGATERQGRPDDGRVVY